MGKVALVTGASSGIGEAIAARLLEDGYIVYAGARRLARMAALERMGARLLALDLTVDASMQAAMQRVLGKTGRIDALVNNAGYGAYGALEEVPLEEGRRQFEVNLFGLARLVQLALPAMREQRSGRIVNITSIGGKIHEPMGSWYHSTKFAVEGLSDCLRMELEPFGISVVVIEPGAIKTEWSGIAQQSLIETSGAGPYADQARTTAALLAGADKGNGSPPELVARAVSAALAARKPKTRYVVGGGAKPLIALRWLLSDRAFDKLMRAAAQSMVSAKRRRSKCSEPSHGQHAT
ncbi:MAG TPA: oxidoreductase [Microvirga sp.]|jgi:NAD(P)-dependent dehydrogenase (short-subunit alcohol dehydrogenase family)|nr:oxidoreductase [Microvirga sp.]